MLHMLFISTLVKHDVDHKHNICDSGLNNNVIDDMFRLIFDH